MAIKKGDRIVVDISGKEVIAVAASDEKDGAVQIKYKGTFSTVNITNVRVLPQFSDAKLADRLGDLTDGENVILHEDLLGCPDDNP